MKPGFWRLAFWVLLISWLIGAGLNMARFQGGFLTNYLSDLAFPPWFYIYIRGLWTNHVKRPRLLMVGDWFGRTRERAFISIFLIGLLTELKTLYWPSGPIAGIFDLLDIFSYGIGLIICYVLDTRKNT